MNDVCSTFRVSGLLWFLHYFRPTCLWFHDLRSVKCTAPSVYEVEGCQRFAVSVNSSRNTRPPMTYGPTFCLYITGVFFGWK